MGLFNSSQQYGALTKLLHWLIVAIFCFQYFAGNVMLMMDGKSVVLGLTQGNYFSWHKSIGLIALAVAIVRLINRTFSGLPAWASTLTDREKNVIHWYEKLLYFGMFLMPISGYVYVMAGGYGVHFFELFHLPNPIGKWKLLAVTAQWTHFIAAYAIVAALVAHLVVVFRHQFFVKDNLLGRMLPGRKSRD